jgi:hypothetical protein
MTQIVEEGKGCSGRKHTGDGMLGWGGRREPFLEIVSPYTP